MAFNLHSKRIQTCYIYPYTGTRMPHFTPMTRREAILRKERGEGLACVYFSVLLFPLFLDLPERLGCSAALVSHLPFLLTSSVNIPWSKGGKGDGDYLYAFEKVVMPIAREFSPEIVLGRSSPARISHSLTCSLSFCRIRRRSGRSLGRMQCYSVWVCPND